MTDVSEIFEHHSGTASRFAITGGLSALWREGGILYAPPARNER